MKFPGRHTTRRVTRWAGAALLATIGLMAALLSIPISLAEASVLSALTGLLLVWCAVVYARRPVDRRLAALADGIRSYEENDYSIRVTTRTHDEVHELAALFNRLGDALRSGKHRVHQRELLLDTILQSAPMGVLLLTPEGRVTYANRAAWGLFGGGARLEGRQLQEFAHNLAPRLRAALLSGTDGVVRLPAVDEEHPEETIKVARRVVHLGDQPQTLVIVERITADVLRQEIQVWKKVIRLMTHELNNSLAPVSSLLHSARVVAGRPESAEKVEELLERVGQRVQTLAEFLDGYARFARLPAPVVRAVEWAPFIDGLRSLMPFQLDGSLPSLPGHFDPTQLEQALINLLKNASESGSAPGEIFVRVETEPAGSTLVSVLDRGCGMDEETRQLAIQPFYTRKPGGSGLGLALSREILEAHGGRLLLEPRAGGGTAAVCVLPPDLSA